MLPNGTNSNKEMISWLSPTSDGGFIASGTISNDTISGIGYLDAYLSKFDSNGDQEWYKTYNDAFKTYGEAGYEYGNAVIQASDGGYVLVGGIETSFLMVIKTDANGTRIWQKNHSIAGNTFGNGVVEVSQGVYAITGETDGSNAKAYLLQIQE